MKMLFVRGAKPHFHSLFHSNCELFSFPFQIAIAILWIFYLFHFSNLLQMWKLWISIQLDGEWMLFVCMGDKCSNVIPFVMNKFRMKGFLVSLTWSHIPFFLVLFWFFSVFLYFWVQWYRMFVSVKLWFDFMTASWMSDAIFDLLSKKKIIYVDGSI